MNGGEKSAQASGEARQDVLGRPATARPNDLEPDDWPALLRAVRELTP